MYTQPGKTRPDSFIFTAIGNFSVPFDVLVPTQFKVVAIQCNHTVLRRHNSHGNSCCTRHQQSPRHLRPGSDPRLVVPATVGRPRAPVARGMRRTTKKQLHHRRSLVIAIFKTHNLSQHQYLSECGIRETCFANCERRLARTCPCEFVVNFAWNRSDVCSAIDAVCLPDVRITIFVVRMSMSTTPGILLWMTSFLITYIPTVLARRSDETAVGLHGKTLCNRPNKGRGKTVRVVFVLLSTWLRRSGGVL